jgi:menaquinone-dependent protoporphyrinogen oxidase
MKSVLVVYATTEGQTRKIAEFIAAALAERGFDASVVDSASDAAAMVQPVCVAAVFCGSVHRHRYQHSLVRFVKDNAGWLAGIPTAFVAVSLTAAGRDERGRADLQEIVAAFCRRTGWAPTMIRHVAGALRYTQYNFVEKWMLRRIAADQGGDTDTSRDHEYTDWDDVTRFVGEFVAAAGLQPDGRHIGDRAAAKAAPD